MQNYTYVPFTAVVSNVKKSWSQEHYVEQRTHELALSTVSHDSRRYPMVSDLVVPPTEPSRFAAGELGKSGKNLEEIGTKFLGPNCFRFV